MKLLKNFLQRFTCFIAGAYTYTFMTPGTYYYYSKPVDSAGLITMRGSVTVTDRTSSLGVLNFTIAGSEAVHNTASGMLIITVISI